MTGGSGDYAHRDQAGVKVPDAQQRQFPDQATQSANPDWQQPSTGTQPYAPPPGPGFQQAQPAPVAQGYPQGPYSTVPTLYAPPDLGPPLYLGTALRLPMRLSCGICGYQGDPAITARRGCAWWMGIMMSFGLLLLCPGWGKDTFVVCPHCKKEVGVAKLM